MEIRPYLEQDEQAVIALWRAVFPGEPARNDPAAVIRRKLAVQRELFLVARDDGGAVVGTVMAGYDVYRGWLYRVAVHPTCQRRGVGTALLRRAEAALAALGCPKVNLQVHGSNAAVVAFYRKLGYAVEDRVSMGKRLE